MGQEIGVSHFTPADLAEFVVRLGAETDLLRDQLAEGRFEAGPWEVGFELEA